MNLMRGFFVFLLLLMITFSGASGADEVSVNFCKLLANPENFAGRVISVRARITKSRHGIVLNGEGCDGAILLELRAEVVPKREAVLTKDSEYEKFDQALFIFKPGSTELKNQIEATFEGRFDTALRMKDGKRVRISKGYGQNSILTSRLVLYKVSDVRLAEKTD
jgi:hypothetical protein